MNARECKACGYRGPMLLAHSKVPANRFPPVYLATIALRFIPIVGFVSQQFLNTPPDCCPNCGERTLLHYWPGPVEAAELELWTIRQKQEDAFKQGSDRRLVPVLVTVIVTVALVILWQLGR